MKRHAGKLIARDFCSYLQIVARDQKRRSPVSRSQHLRQMPCFWAASCPVLEKGIFYEDFESASGAGAVVEVLMEVEKRMRRSSKYDLQPRIDSEER